MVSRPTGGVGAVISLQYHMRLDEKMRDKKIVSGWEEYVAMKHSEKSHLVN